MRGRRIGEEQDAAWQGHHHLRRYRVDPYPDDEPHLPLTPDEIARDASLRPRRDQRSRIRSTFRADAVSSLTLT